MSFSSDTNRENSITLDWLAFTIKESTNATKRCLDVLCGAEATIPAKPTNGYTQARTGANGSVAMWNVSRPEMGTHVVLSGTTLAKIATDTGLQQIDILKTALQSGGLVSRLDLAKDVKNVAIDFGAIWNDFNSAKRTGTARKVARMQGSDGGDTIYVGSRTSERFVRLYDKAAQMALSGVNWSRLEVELKGQTARAMAHFLTGSLTWADAFDTMVEEMVNVPGNLDWRAFFKWNRYSIGLPKVERRSDTEAWIEGQVLPAVLRYMAEHPKSEVIQRLMDALYWQWKNSE